MSTASAELVVERQLRPIGDGYKWRFDSRFRHASTADYQQPVRYSARKRTDYVTY